jgi:hypothetical protein
MIEVFEMFENELVVFCIRDYGRGIDDCYAPKI